MILLSLRTYDMTASINFLISPTTHSCLSCNVKWQLSPPGNGH